VFFTHLFLLADPGQTNMLVYGWAGPILGHIDLGLAAFFVLSGYLIARPFARAYVAGTRRPPLRDYVRNRVLRVVPAFYVFTVLVLLRFGLDGTLASGSHNASSWSQVLGQFLFVQGQAGGPAAVPIGPAWSIGAEVGFYVLIPLSAFVAYRVGARLRGPGSRAAVALAAIAALTFVSIAARAYQKFDFTWLTSPPAIMYVFMPGVAVAIIEPLLVSRLRGNARLARPVAWAAFAAAAVAAVAYAASDYDVRQTPIHHALGQRALLAALCTGALIFGLVVLQLGTDRAPRLFGNRLMLWMGARSYSFYLAHFWILLEIDHALGSGESIATRAAIMAAVGLPVTTAIAALSYRFVERPFLERKRRAVTRGPGSGPAGPPVGAEPVPVAVGPVS
ncbi:MAG TPA: acyltransferase, partial [Solirubrobacteraceae bacterium]|nr:acyltransferase [Solirubrobacteraceae bacterium]